MKSNKFCSSKILSLGPGEKIFDVKLINKNIRVGGARSRCILSLMHRNLVVTILNWAISPHHGIVDNKKQKASSTDLCRGRLQCEAANVEFLPDSR